MRNMENSNSLLFTKYQGSFSVLALIYRIAYNIVAIWLARLADQCIAHLANREMVCHTVLQLGRWCKEEYTSCIGLLALRR